MMFCLGRRGRRAVLAAGVCLAAAGAAQGQITTCEVVTENRAPDAAKVEALAAQAQEGAAKPQYELGCLYRWGKGVRKDFRQALAWFIKAADQDDAAARHEIADMYKHGQGFAGEMARAFSAMEQEAQAGDADARYTLGMMYLYGLGTDPDEAQAVAWYEKSAAQGNAYAQGRLAGMYARGQGVGQDLAKAFALGKKAADAGHVMSMLNLGRMYETGTGIEPDVAMARSYYLKASEKGNRLATVLLRQLDGGSLPAPDADGEESVPEGTVEVMVDVTDGKVEAPLAEAAPSGGLLWNAGNEPDDEAAVAADAVTADAAAPEPAPGDGVKPGE